MGCDVQATLQAEKWNIQRLIKQKLVHYFTSIDTLKVIFYLQYEHWKRMNGLNSAFSYCFSTWK